MNARIAANRRFGKFASLGRRHGEARQGEAMNRISLRVLAGIILQGVFFFFLTQ